MKIPYSFGYPFFVRILLPGFIGSIVLYPLTSPIINVFFKFANLSNNFLTPALPTNIGIAIFIQSILVGILVSFMDRGVYQFFEGYRFWPDFLKNWFVKRLNKKIDKKYVDFDSKSDTERAMIWQRLSMFPINVSNQERSPRVKAVLPTLLGNILEQYESYPKTRYNMDPVFYWPRIWLTLDDSKRKEIMTFWSEADCFVYTAFVMFVSGILYLSAFLLHYFNIIVSISPDLRALFSSVPNVRFLLILGIVSFSLSYFFYRISVWLHIRNGEYFKSAFDLHRRELSAIGKIDGIQIGDWDEILNYLNFLLVRCKKCRRYYSRSLDKCPYPECGAPNERRQAVEG